MKSYLGFPSGSDGKESACNAEDQTEGCGTARPALQVDSLLWSHWGRSPIVRTAVMKKITSPGEVVEKVDHHCAVGGM